MKYKAKKKSTSNYDLYKQLTECRELDEFNQFNVTIQRTVLNRLHKAFQSFFYRIKRGENPGFPRFKGKDRQIRSFETSQFNIKQQGKYNVVKIKGIGKFRFKGEVPENVKFVRIVKTPLRVKIQIIHEKSLAIENDSRELLGIDVGIKSRITLSNGVQVRRFRYSRNDQER